MIQINAYAKINLYLDITKKRDDGFHDIESYMQTVSLCDTVTLEKAESGIRLVGDYGVDEKKDLAFRAAELFFEKTGLQSGVSIEISKRIPMQGGLAGGSADAAAVLNGLNKLYEVGLSKDELASIGALLGSDVPFCVSGGSKLTYGRGEILHDAPKMTDCGIVIAKGSEGMSTPAQYKMLDGIYNDFEGYKPQTEKLNAVLESIEKNDIRKLGANLFNIFEKTGGYDTELMNIMKEHGAAGVLLSGSGSSVFGIFESIDTAKAVADFIEKTGKTAFACVPVDV